MKAIGPEMDLHRRSSPPHDGYSRPDHHATTVQLFVPKDSNQETDVKADLPI